MMESLSYRDIIFMGREHLNISTNIFFTTAHTSMNEIRLLTDSHVLYKSSTFLLVRPCSNFALGLIVEAQWGL